MFGDVVGRMLTHVKVEKSAVAEAVRGEEEMASQVTVVTPSTNASPFGLEAYLPSPSADAKQVLRATNDRAFYYLNYRPITPPAALSKLLNDRIRKHFNAPPKKYPFLFFHILTDPDRFDGK